MCVCMVEKKCIHRVACTDLLNWLGDSMNMEYLSMFDNIIIHYKLRVVEKELGKELKYVH